DQNGDTVDYWDLPKILDPYRDDVILAMDQGAVCLSVDAEHSGLVVLAGALYAVQMKKRGVMPLVSTSELH
ncbi:hypothetical protein MJL48_31830, partial [Salmonella enterica subsp. enterica serovar Kentucky]|nr:hypothetical protein [Salmonella enterica subsp. enterica serovar Kentucky]